MHGPWEALSLTVVEGVLPSERLDSPLVLRTGEELIVEAVVLVAQLEEIRQVLAEALACVAMRTAQMRRECSV